MRLRFRGEEDGAPCVVFGLTFPAGVWVVVSDPPRKLLTNPMFEVGEDQPRLPQLDHDNDGRPGGSLPRGRRVKRGDLR